MIKIEIKAPIGNFFQFSKFIIYFCFFLKIMNRKQNIYMYAFHVVVFILFIIFTEKQKINKDY
jgi:hypothetical protein